MYTGLLKSPNFLEISFKVFLELFLKISPNFLLASKNPIKITTQQIQQLSTTSTDKPTPISTPLPTFMSLFDLMYEGNEEEVEEECLQQIAGTSCNISPQSTSKIISQQQQPTISNFFQTVPTTKISENKTNEGGEEGCLYEPLSSDDEP